MNKNKEWLIKRVENYIPLNDKKVRHVVDNILDIISQLDEPEVLSQDWIDKNKFEVDCWNEAVHVEDLQNLLVPKQELPVIPKIVVDWFEENKKDLEYAIYFISNHVSVEVAE